MCLQCMFAEIRNSANRMDVPHFVCELQQYMVSLVAISLGDIHNMPTRSKFVFFQVFLNFLSKAPKFHSVGGGYVYTF